MHIFTAPDLYYFNCWKTGLNMKRNKIAENSLNSMIRASFILMLLQIVAIYMGFTAEPFVQEVGMGKTILGANRDWLVSARPWFIGGLAVSLLAFIYAQYRLHRYTKSFSN